MWNDIYLKMITFYILAEIKGQLSVPSGVNFLSN